MKIRC